MDKKTGLVLTLAKYGAYMTVLWISLSNRWLDLEGPLLFFATVFAVDNIRSFYLESKARQLVRPALFLQLALVLLFIFMGGGVVGGILLVVLVTESLILYPRPLGDHIFILSLAGYLGAAFGNLYRQDQITAENGSLILVNSLFLFFAYGVSYLARRQIEEKERAEKALEELDRSRRELEMAHRKLLESSKEREKLAVMEERNRLAREIHDTLAHTLTTVIIGLEAGKKLLNRDTARAASELEKSLGQARKGLDEVRRSVRELRPRELDDFGFDAALKGLAREFESAGVAVHFALPKGAAIARELELPIYRVVQESVTNSVRHGGASRISVRLKRQESGLVLEIEDDGRGCVPITEGYGLRGIRERMAAAGGRVELMNLKPRGFLVRATIEGRSFE